MAKMQLSDVDIRDKRVLMRVDFNVPIRQGQVANDKRIRAAIPTIRYILAQGAKLILMSHLGRPKGEPDPQMSLKPCVPVLAGYLKQPVSFAPDCVGQEVDTLVRRLSPGDVLLLENLRFHAGETKNDMAFSGQLGALAEVYVNDAFGSAHRAHASTEGVTRFVKPCVAGLLMVRELEYLGNVIQHPGRPFVAVLGGAKISGKIDVIRNLLPKVDRLIIGGGMAFTFLRARGLAIGRSLVEEEKIDLARSLLAEAGDKIVLPADCMVSDAFDFETGAVGPLSCVGVEAVSGDSYGLDIGPSSIALFEQILRDAKTVVWNGPMGVFEIPSTATGTYEMAKILARVTDKGGVSVIGGGDSAAAAEKSGVAERISHISTGGGASLEFLEGKMLPGVAALTDK